MASQKDIDRAWEKTQPIHGKNPDVWGKDQQGNVIRKPSYGTHGEYGWELDHKNPVARGGTNKPQNIQPLHWEENREKSDKHPISQSNDFLH